MTTQTDNQQRKATETDIAWLAGLWDGEGSIGMKIAKYFTRANGEETVYTAPYAQVVNTHVGTLDRVDAILKDLHVGHHIQWPKPRQHPNGSMPISNYKPLWSVRIHGLKRCKTLLVALKPFLVTKREQAELVWEFIQSRESEHYQRLPYTERELEIVNVFRRSRHSGKATEALVS